MNLGVLAAIAATVVSVDHWHCEDRTIRSALPPAKKERREPPPVASWNGDGIHPNCETRQQRRARERRELEKKP